MDIPTAIKYLDFVAIECERHLKDENVSNDELNQLIIEYQRFIERVNNSDLPIELKNEIAEFKFDYTTNKIKMGTLFLIITILTFGSWSYFLNRKMLSKRKQTLEELKQVSSTLGFKIRLNY